MADHHSSKAGHIVPLKVYLRVGAALIILTALTVTLSQIRLGGWNVAVALTIAAAKATLVAFFFMHLLYDRKFYRVIFLMGVIIIAVFITITMFDTQERGFINPQEGKPYRPEAVIYQNKGVDSSSVAPDTAK